jgi:hypothetical protein
VFVVFITIGQFVLFLVVFVAWSLTKLGMFCCFVIEVQFFGRFVLAGRIPLCYS